MKNLVWKPLGGVGVDAGCLMICDPCYVVGKDSEINRAKPGGWSQFIEEQCRYGSDESDHHEIPYALGHSGLGVFANTRHGDGHFTVYGLFDATDIKLKRPHAMIVVTGDHKLNTISTIPIH